MRERTAQLVLAVCALLLLVGIWRTNVASRPALAASKPAEAIQFVAIAQASAVDKGERMRSERFRVSPGGSLVVKVPGADVNVRSGNVREATVEIFAFHRTSQERARQYFERFNWEISERSNVVTVVATRPRTPSWSNNGVSLTVEVTIPERFQTDVNTSGGDITAEALEGRTSLRTSGGDIDVARIQGEEILLSTSGGDITATDLDGRIELRTSGGDINVGTARGPQLSVHTSGGDITARRLEARTMKISTSGGDIELGELYGDAEVRTSGGDIELGRTEGALTAATSGGDIEVVLTRPSAVSLSTSGGDVIVFAPSNLRAELDLRGRSVRLGEDFDFRGDQTRRRISGSVGGGGPMLKATTSSGSVVLRVR